MTLSPTSPHPTAPAWLVGPAEPPVGDLKPRDPAAAGVVDGWLRRYAETRDPQLRERIVLAYLGMADRLAGRYRGSHGVTLDDLRQVARLGLIAAVDRYDPGRGRPFVPYAVACVVGELKRHLRDTTWTVRVPRPLKERALAACRALDDLSGELGRAPTAAELAERLRVPVREAAQAVAVLTTRSQASLDQPLGDAEEATLGDLLADPSQQEELDDLLALPQLVRRLPDRERQVVRQTYVEELSQTQIAQAMGCSQMQVSRLLRRALERLREGF
jgi:RNA polymerase sigma-B factor